MTQRFIQEPIILKGKEKQHKVNAAGPPVPDMTLVERGKIIPRVQQFLMTRTVPSCLDGSQGLKGVKKPS